MRMLNRNPKRLSAEVFSSAQKQPKQNASSQNREENGSTTLRNTREKPLLAGYVVYNPVRKINARRYWQSIKWPHTPLTQTLNPLRRRYVMCNDKINKMLVM